MPIYRGTQKIKSLYVGSQKIKAAHVWNGSAWKKVFSSGKYYLIDFNATGPLPAGWTTSSTAPTVINGSAQCPTSVGSSTSTWAVCSQDLATDDVSVFVTIVAPTTPYASEESGIMLRGATPWSLGTHAELSFSTGKGCAIKSVSGGAATVRASTTTNIAYGDTVEFTAVGNVYRAYRNGSTTPFLTWTDTGNLIEAGPFRRRFGFFVAAIRTDKNYYTPAIDAIEARDI
ncbi:hypothetical protein [Prescottella agglutinans]|uniref:Uncharacterized protein n=1 Tax=Prescottella agglutinans TaxID=1644129 RepID=A0ABT6M5G3_9NOCA|nr:hypothetical protein [Prescottella agglutinans]MDH6279533.1 hypothetical protein [Prescottella agglutinans]